MKVKVLPGTHFKGGKCGVPYDAFTSQTAAEDVANLRRGGKPRTWDCRPNYHDTIVGSWWIVVEDKEPEFNECGEVCF